MKDLRKVLWWGVVFVLFRPLYLAAQGTQTQIAGGTGISQVSGTAGMIVNLRLPNEEPLPVTATVRLTVPSAKYDASTPTAQKSHAEFKNLPLGNYGLEVTAPGYATVQLGGEFAEPGKTVSMTVYLRTVLREAAPSGTWVPALPARINKDFGKAVDAIRAGKLTEADKYVRSIMHSAPGHPEVNYMAGVYYYLLSKPAIAQYLFLQATYLNPDSDSAARALAGLLYRQKNYAWAARAFESALATRPNSWDLEWALASTAFQMQDYQQTRVHAGRALALGGILAPQVELLAAFADAKLHNWAQAREGAKLFLQHAPKSALAPTAEEIVRGASVQETFFAGLEQPFVPPVERVQATLVTLDMFEPRVPARLWAPPDVIDETPPVAAGVTCSTEKLLVQAGKNMQRLTHDMGEIGATEEIEQAELDGVGNATKMAKIHTRYLADVREMRQNDLSVEEYRESDVPNPTKGSAPISRGLVALALIFHPKYVSDFDMKCEGLGQWNGRPAWQVYFQQRRDKEARIRVYRAEAQVFPVQLRGRAWMDQNSGEILRVETDLIEPIIPLHLEQEHLIVDYGEVVFQQGRSRFWLPSNAELYIHLRGKLFRVRHKLEKYVLFSVDTKTEIKAPKEPQ